MKVNRTIAIPAKTVEQFDHYVCDRCGKKIEVEDRFDAFECDIRLTTGENYPEGGLGVCKRVDLCPECAEWTFEHIAEIGINVNREDWDW